MNKLLHSKSRHQGSRDLVQTMAFITKIATLLVLGVCSSSLLVSAQCNDDTRKINTFGREVVEAAGILITRADIFPNDHGLLRRIACVESKYGTNPDTYNGGIWRVSIIGLNNNTLYEYLMGNE